MFGIDPSTWNPIYPYIIKKQKIRSNHSSPFAFLLFDLQVALLSVAYPELGEVRTQYFLKDLSSGLGFALVDRTDSVSLFCELKLLVIPLLES